MHDGSVGSCLSALFHPPHGHGSAVGSKVRLWVLLRRIGYKLEFKSGIIGFPGLFVSTFHNQKWNQLLHLCFGQAVQKAIFLLYIDACRKGDHVLSGIAMRQKNKSKIGKAIIGMQLLPCWVPCSQLVENDSVVKAPHVTCERNCTLATICIDFLSAGAKKVGYRADLGDLMDMDASVVTSFFLCHKKNPMGATSLPVFQHESKLHYKYSQTAKR